MKLLNRTFPPILIAFVTFAALAVFSPAYAYDVSLTNIVDPIEWTSDALVQPGDITGYKVDITNCATEADRSVVVDGHPVSSIALVLNEACDVTLYALNNQNAELSVPYTVAWSPGQFETALKAAAFDLVTSVQTQINLCLDQGQPPCTVILP